MKPLVEALKIAFKAINTNKMRAFLTMLGVIIGVLSVVLLVAIGNGLKLYITEQFEGLGSNLIIVMPGKVKIGSGGGDPSANFSNTKLSEKEAENIRRYVKEAEQVSVESGTNKTVSYKGKDMSVMVQIGDEYYSSVRNYSASEGRFFTKADISSKVVVIGKTVVKELFNSNSPINKYLTVDDKKFLVIGVYDKKGAVGGSDLDASIVIPFDIAKVEFGLDKISNINVKTSKDTDINKVKKEVEKAILKTLSKDDFTVLTQEELLTSISGILNTLTIALGGIAAISLLVGGIGIMNIMLVSVTERTREIGLRKALGATPNNLLLQFILESVMLSSIGGTIGILLSLLLANVLNNFVTTRVPLWAVALAFAFSVLVGIIFGTYPAYKAAKKNPIEALRYE